MTSVNGFSVGFSAGGGYDGNDRGGGREGGPSGGPVIRSKGILASDICCYGCGEAVSAKVTITSCLCTFCEDCMERFMTNSNNCPSCGSKMKSSEFAEVAIANFRDASVFDKDLSIIDSIMTTTSSDGTISVQQMVMNLYREYDKHEKRARLIFNQISTQACKFVVPTTETSWI